MKTVIISGSRADRGPLTPVADILDASWVMIDPPLSHNQYDSAISSGHAVVATAKKLADIKPDLVVLLGDRYEVLGAAVAANLMGIPIAHLSGGDITEGSQDDALRHAITKLSHLHFPTNQDAANRILAMGEEPWRVHTVGCPGIDNALATEFYSREDTQRRLGVFSSGYYLVAYQPATLANDPVAEVNVLLQGLDKLPLPCVFTTVNADAWGREIQDRLMRFCAKGHSVITVMDSRLFLSALKHCRAMIGNSSSGLYEAPSLKKPFVLVGDRQKGRLLAGSVIQCPLDAGMIYSAIRLAVNLDCREVVNPYGAGNSAKLIQRVLLEQMTVDRHKLLRKKWGTDDRSQLGSAASAA